jgi:uncharacterized membrane protein
MDFTISPLTAERWPGLEDLFGRAGASNGCWCMYWRIGPRYHDRPRADNKRDLQQLVASGPPPGLLAYLAISGRGLSAVAIVVAAYSFSATSSLVFFITTFAVFQDADADSLARWVAATAPTGRLSTVQAEFAGTGLTITVQWSGLAIVSVVVLALSPHLYRQPLVVALSAAVVATSWLVTIVSYAVHYARLSATVGGLTFPGAGGVVFWDCVYLATQVQTTFSSSDVVIETTLSRRIVTGHTLVAFAFNTVIIALLIAVLFLGHN